MEERLNDGDNNGQATHGARKPPTSVKNMSKFLFMPFFWEALYNFGLLASGHF